MKILVGMSGGVDSAVAAYLLKQEGHELIGATMSIWDKEQMHKIPGKEGCFIPNKEQDIAEAKKICTQLNIPHYVFDCTEQYKKIVLDNFKQEYLNGRTPNPCIICNSTIKFNALPEAAQTNGLEFDKFATGHYVRLSQNQQNQRWKIQTAIDKNKDQSYFLYRLTQKQLSKVVMPLGEYTKAQIRDIAHNIGLIVSDKPDSQDFYNGDLNDIIQAEPKQGNFVTSSGKILGTHNGIWNFTIGQRRGLGISAEKPLYVIELNKDKNEVVVGFEDEAFKTSIIAHNLSWLSVESLSAPQKVWAKIRSSQKPVEAIATVENDELSVKFISPQKALTPGQSVVLYDDDEFVLGGGVIDKVS